MAQAAKAERTEDLAVCENADETGQRWSFGAEHEFRMALLGRTGSGKSATGNHILNVKAFQSRPSSKSITRKCKFHTAERFDRKLVVVDTPGLFDTDLSKTDVMNEIVKCIGILTPGPHVFILVLPPERFTDEVQNTVHTFHDVFGEGFFRHLIVIFSRKDEFDESFTLDNFVDDAQDELKYILQKCDYRYLGFDNSKEGMKGDSDVLALIGMLNKTTEQNGNSYYSNAMFKIAEEEFQRRAKQIRLKEEKQIADEDVKIQDKIDAELKEIGKQIMNLQKESTVVDAKHIKITEMENKLRELIKKRDKTEREIHELEMAIDAQRKRLVDQEKDLKPRKKEHADLNSEIKTTEKELGKNRVELDNAQKRRAAASKDIDQREQNKNKLKEMKLQVLQEKQKYYQDQIENMRDNDRREFENGNFIATLVRILGMAVQTIKDVVNRYWSK